MTSSASHFRYFLLAFLCCAFLLVSCGKDEQTRRDEAAMFERMDSLGNLCRYTEVLAIGDSLLERLVEGDDDSLRCEVLNWMGMANFYLGNMDEAVRYQQQCYDIDRRMGDPALMSSDLNQITAYSLRTGQYDQGRECILEAIKIEKELGRDEVLAMRYGIASEVFLKLKDYGTARDFAQKSLDIERRLGRDAKVGVRLSQLAAVMMASPPALPSREGALKSLSPDDPSRKSINDSVRAMLEEAVPLLREAGNINSLAITYCQLGDLAISNNENDRAQQHYTEALMLCSRMGNKFTEKRALQGIWNVLKVNDTALGASYLERYTTLTDSLATADAANELNTLKRQYETRELQLDNERLTARNHLSTLFIVSLIVVVVLLVVIIYLLRHTRLSKQRLMQQMEAVRINFFTNITHEFRTPLTVILGVGEELEQQPGTREQGRMITQEGRGLLNLVNQLLDISKIKSSIGEAHWRHGNVIGYMNMVVESLRPLAVKSNIELVFSPEQNEVDMDFVPDYIRKIVRNLMSNALKFTPQNGRILISTESKGSSLVLKIADNGSGISLSEQQHIFDPFYQAENSHTAIGTGVGLSLVKLLVQAMDGTIQVKSSPKVGTVFIVELPVKNNTSSPSLSLPSGGGDLDTPSFSIASSQDSSILPPPEGRAGERYTILIVEDNANVASYMSSQLGDSYYIYTARNGKDGLQRARSLVPDLIITDLMMPVMDGMELCHAVRNDELLNHIPLIVVTAKATDDDRIEGIDAGADAYLCKPFNADELRLRVARLIEQRRLLREKFQRALQAGNTDEVEMSAADREFLDRVVNTVYSLMSNNKKADINTLSDELSMSVRSFTRKLQAITGESPMLYINRIKIDRAKHLIDTTPDIQLADVAYRSGFDDPAYFSRVFKQITDTTPTTYRRRLK